LNRFWKWGPHGQFGRVPPSPNEPDCAASLNPAERIGICES
jgi:hypothetical protein